MQLYVPTLKLLLNSWHDFVRNFIYLGGFWKRTLLKFSAIGLIAKRQMYFMLWRAQTSHLKSKTKGNNEKETLIVHIILLLVLSTTFQTFEVLVQLT